MYQTLLFFFQGILEGIAMAYFGLTIFRFRFRLDDLLTIGLLIAVMGFIVRQLPLSFGVHSIILVGWMVLLICWRLKAKVSKAFGAALVTSGTLAVLETIMFALAIGVFGMSYDGIMNHAGLRTLFGLMCPSAMFLIAWLIKIMCGTGKRSIKGRG